MTENTSEVARRDSSDGGGKKMANQETIVCAFCQGTGKHPHFTGTCPVCKGRGKNQVTGKVMICRDCRGSGQKRGTSLTCYTCGGLGIIPDTREIFKKAKKEIEKARKEMKKERGEFRELPPAERNMEKIENLEAENKRLREKLVEFKESKAPALPSRSELVSSKVERKAIKNAIASFCSDCALGEEKKCWHIKCPLAPYSSVAAMISHPSTGSGPSALRRSVAQARRDDPERSRMGQ